MKNLRTYTHIEKPVDTSALTALQQVSAVHPTWDFSAYQHEAGDSIEGIYDGDLLEPGDYVIVGRDGFRARSEKAFFETQYRPLD